VLLFVPRIQTGEQLHREIKETAMTQTIEAVNGGYRFMAGVSQYSCGIAALAGFSIERICFSNVVPLKQGFEKIAGIIKAAGRPLTAFGACELRSPAPFTATAVQLYTVRNVFPFLESELGKRGVLRHGLTWHFNRPPVVDLEYEMDCRRVSIERVIEV
jgi:hypothetical protein